MRQETGLVTFDPGFVNTANCQSRITFVDGEKGILRYRGYNIEDLQQPLDPLGMQSTVPVFRNTLIGEAPLASKATSSGTPA